MYFKAHNCLNKLQAMYNEKQNVSFSKLVTLINRAYEKNKTANTIQN